MTDAEHTAAAGDEGPADEIDELRTHRPPVGIDGRRLAIDTTVVEAYSGHIDDVLVAFIELIRLVRRGPSPARMAFRRIDIEALAAHLAVAGEVVVDHLAVLVGADDDRLGRMTRHFEAGAAVIDSGLRDIELDELDVALV